MPHYLLRHCHALGQAPDAALSERGRAQAEALVAALAPLPFSAIVASPWARAVATVAPLAAARGLPVDTDERLTEYVLAPAPRDDWRDELARNFATPVRTLPGGESVAAAAERIGAVVARCAVPTLVVTHGGLLAAYVERLAPGTGFATWERLGTPSLWVVERGAARELPLAP